MAELTKDNIKEALGFIADGKRIFGIFDKAEAAIAVLGQLNATVESLGKKAEGLRAEVAGLEGQKAKFATEREAQKKTLDEQRVSAMNSIEAEADATRREARAEFDKAALAFAEDLDTLKAEKATLVKDISGLSKKRDGILLYIEALISNQAAEQSRLDAILAQIAELKSRL
jgi:chromosome segregation ATPase